MKIFQLAVASRSWPLGVMTTGGLQLLKLSWSRLIPRAQLLAPLEMEIHPSLAMTATPQSQRPSASSGPPGSPAALAPEPEPESAAGASFEPGLVGSPLEGSAAPPMLHPLEVRWAR
jgi:hypothetical protein